MKKILRYIFGTLWCLFVWLFVAVVVGFITLLIFPSHEQNVTVGISADWRNIPGTLLGLLAAVQSWRKHVTPPKAAKPPAE